jgi:hypothetical protein
MEYLVQLNYEPSDENNACVLSANQILDNVLHLMKNNISMNSIRVYKLSMNNDPQRVHISFIKNTLYIHDDHKNVIDVVTLS